MLKSGEYITPMKSIKVAGTRYVMPGWYYSDYNSNDSDSGVIYYIPIYVADNTVYDKIGIGILAPGAAGKKARLGIYHWSDGLPGDLLIDCGQVAIDGAGAVEADIAVTLLKGQYYFLAIVCDDTPTLRCPQGAAAVVVPVTTGATSMIGPCDRVILSVAGQTAQVADGLSDPAVVAGITLYDVEKAFVRLREV